MDAGSSYDVRRNRCSDYVEALYPAHLRKSLGKSIDGGHKIMRPSSAAAAIYTAAGSRVIVPL
jgi:hypothetical protein